MWNKGEVYDVHHLLSTLFCSFGPCPHRDRDYQIGSNFWKFYLIRIDFTLSKLVSLVKMFRLFRLERSFLGVQSVNTLSRCTTSYLLAGPACLWWLVLFAPVSSIDSCLVLSCHVTKSFSHDTYAPSHQICWNVSFISLWETSVYIIIYHLGRSLKRGTKCPIKTNGQNHHTADKMEDFDKLSSCHDLNKFGMYIDQSVHSCLINYLQN